MHSSAAFTTAFHSLSRAALAGAAVLCALALSGAAQGRAKDTVALNSGESATGRIKSEDYAALVLEEKAGQDKNIAWADIKTIDYGTLPELAGALASYRSGKLDEAITLFDELLKDKKPKPVAQQQAYYHIALIAQKQGRVDDAIEGYKQLFAAFPKGRYLRMGGENFSYCYILKGDFANAGGVLDQIAKGAADQPGFKPEYAFLKGRVFEAEGKRWAEARAQYEAAEKSSDPNLALEAQLGRGRCLLNEGKVAEAEPLFRKLTTEKAPNRVLAGAWNGLGELATNEGKSTLKPDKLIDAATSYLRGAIQYRPAPGESETEYERALAGAARAFGFLRDLEKNAERKKVNAQRAAQFKDQLAREFPNSPFLKDL